MVHCAVLNITKKSKWVMIQEHIGVGELYGIIEGIMWKAYRKSALDYSVHGIHVLLVWNFFMHALC